MKNRAFWAFIVMGATAACNNTEKIKHSQYIAEGAELYKNNCANCHQTDGTGLEGLYPNISKNLKTYTDSQLACIIKNGIKAMPASKLEALEIAETITFIRHTWGQKDSLTSIAVVEEAMLKCKQ
jgi:mono/diheme cytochrome c family protein